MVAFLGQSDDWESHFDGAANEYWEYRYFLLRLVVYEVSPTVENAGSGFL